ncbi:MAG TPA: DUF3341 domain-containing protein [Thermoanaerobaculia bacterium]
MSTANASPQGSYGLMAEFDSPQALVAAARAARAAGYTRLDAYTPFPVEELPEALGLPRSKVPLVVLAGGVLGGLGGWFLQYWSQVLHYPMNIGGRPYNSWPAFIVPTFECTILLAAISGVVGMIALNGLPRPYHPAFNWDRFLRASRDRYFLAVEADDPRFDRGEVERFLRGLPARPTEVTEVED